MLLMITIPSGEPGAYMGGQSYIHQGVCPQGHGSVQMQVFIEVLSEIIFLIELRRNVNVFLE